MKFTNAFAMVYTICSFIYISLFFFVKIPDSNRDIVNIITGVVITTGLVTIINYLFGSSKSSADKNEAISKALEEKK